jgi:hypothetical protein
MSSTDKLGDLLREFYAVYGVADEGPPNGTNVSALVGTDFVSINELDVLRNSLNDEILLRQFGICRDILDDLASHLTGTELLRELSSIDSVSDRQIEELSNGVFWFALASTLDQRAGEIPRTPFDEQINLPLPLKVRLTVGGSLVLRLYVALVYVREGPLSDFIARGARAGNPCCVQVKKLLNCDYVRHMRNALSHGSFCLCIAGITFRDDNHIVVATPGFLNWLCTWLMLIQLQALAASSRTREC